MTQANDEAACERLWQAWLALVDTCKGIGQRRDAQFELWKASTDAATRALLWREYETLSRDWDTARVRAEVAFIRYTVAKHGLKQSDIFDVG